MCPKNRNKGRRTSSLAQLTHSQVSHLRTLEKVGRFSEELFVVAMPFDLARLVMA
jgi:hypothetical protein